MSDAFIHIVFTAQDLEALLETRSSPTDNKCRVCDKMIPKSLMGNVAHLRTHTKPELYEWIECPECGGDKFIDVADGEDSKQIACEVCNPHGDEEDPDRAYDAMKDDEAEEYFEMLEHENAEGSQ